MTVSIRKTLLCIFHIFVFISVWGQQDFDSLRIQNILLVKNILKSQNIFKKFDVVSINELKLYNDISRNKQCTSIDLNLSLSDSRDFWTLDLEEVDVLSENFKIYELQEDGSKILSATNITTKAYKGVFSDNRIGSARLTIGHNFLYGLVEIEGTTFYIEPISYFGIKNNDNLYVIYDSKEIYEEHNHFTCRHLENIQESVALEPSEEFLSNGDCYKIKLAIAADYSMFADPAHPGVNNLTNHIIGVMNNVQDNYEFNGNTNFSNGINFEISEIVISTCPNCDQWSAVTNPTQLLFEFDSWVGSGGFSQTFHAGHFWTNRDLNGNVVGLAFQGPNLMCTRKALIVLEDWTTNAALLRVMVAHEVGHSFNGVHDATTNFILSSTLTATNTWSNASKTSIGTQITNQGNNCLEFCGLVSCAAITNLNVTNINNNNFTLSWNATPNNSYVVKIKNVGDQNFILDTIVSVNSLILSPPGFGICKKYEVFVYNRCSANNLSSLRRIFIQGSTSQGCADFAAQKMVGWTGNTVSFQDKSLNATSWFWDFGNGQTSTLQNPSATFTQAGSYSVQLTVNNIHTMTMDPPVTILPYLPIPFTLAQGGNFESNAGVFASSVVVGNTNLWQRGTSTFRRSTQGIAYKTLLNDTIPRVTNQSALYSSSFNFTSHADIVLHFDMSMQHQFCNGPLGLQLQYSLNDGESWTRLGSFGDNGPNIIGWYQNGPGSPCPFEASVFSDRTGWAFNSSYTHKSYDLGFLAGQEQVIFRFLFSVSGIFNGGYNSDGVLIDNFRIEAYGPLPLKVSSLTARKVDKTTKLDWEVYHAKDIQKFEIERSHDGKVFSFLASLDEIEPSALNFTYVDKNPLNGFNYYKITAVYFDQTTEYSNVVSTVHESFFEEFTIFPNPLPNGASINFKYDDRILDPTSFTLYDKLGRLVYSELISKSKEFFIKSLTNDFYVLKVDFSNQNSRYFKLLIQD